MSHICSDLWNKIVSNCLPESVILLKSCNQLLKKDIMIKEIEFLPNRHRYKADVWKTIEDNKSTIKSYILGSEVLLPYI